MSRGLMASSASGPRPSSSSAPGRMFCRKTSTSRAYAFSHSTAAGSLRSRMIERLPPLTLWNVEPAPSRNGGPQPRASSPPSGRSTFTTSAPSRTRVSPAKGPARFCAISTTLIPASGSAVIVASAARPEHTVCVVPWARRGSVPLSPSRQRASSRRQGGPERVGSPAGDIAAERGRPPALAAELRAPGPEPPRDELEVMLVGEAEGAVDLMRDRRGDSRRLARPRLGDADLEGGVAPVGRTERVGGRDIRRRGVTGEDREVLLDGLVRPDRLAELPALGRVARGRLQNSVDSTRDLRGPRERAVLPHRVGRDASTRGSRRDGRPIEEERVARLAGEVSIGRDAEGARH